MLYQNTSLFMCISLSFVLPSLFRIFNLIALVIVVRALAYFGLHMQFTLVQVYAIGFGACIGRTSLLWYLLCKNKFTLVFVMAEQVYFGICYGRSLHWYLLWMNKFALWKIKITFLVLVLLHGDIGIAACTQEFFIVEGIRIKILMQSNFKQILTSVIRWLKPQCSLCCFM